MDVLSGLELAEKIAEKEPEISFAFLSAYDSFEYAVKALKIASEICVFTNDHITVETV